jgi:Na+-driven multidrug efflux pump
MISFLPAFGFAIAASTLTGQALGARRPDLAERTAWVAVRSAALWMGAMSVVFLLFPEALLRVFTAEPELIEIGIPSLRVIAFATPLLAVPMVLSGALRGAGDTRFPMVLTTVCSWLVRTPIGFLLALPLGLGLPGAYAGLLADAVVGGLLTVWRFRRGAWREVKV